MCNECLNELEAQRYDEFEDEAPASKDWRTRRFLGRPWQDLGFTAAGIVFLVGLMPLLWLGYSIPPATGLSTAIMLYGIVVCQVSYGNWLAVIETLFTATVWLLIGFGVHL